jgi:hypothetical protein
LGDSRAIISTSLGFNINSLSIDHKPNIETEKQRIKVNGGFVFESNPTESCSGLYRTTPGKLTVSRTIGDVEAKLEYLGGLPGVIIPIPDIISFKIQNDADFIILGSDGLFDKLPNKDITLIVFETLKYCIKSNLTFRDTLVKITNKLIIEAIDRESKDNISCIVLFFDNLYQKFINKDIEDIDTTIRNLRYASVDYNDLYENLITKSLYEDFNHKERSQSKYSIIKSSKNNSSANVVLNKVESSKTITNSEIVLKEKNSKKKSACSCVCNIY